MHICVVFTCFKSYLLHFPRVYPNTRVSLHSEVLSEALFRSCNNHTGLRRVFFSLSKFSHCTPDSVCVRSVSLPFPFLIQGSGAFNRFANLPNVYTYKSFQAAFLWVVLSAIFPFEDTPTVAFFRCYLLNSPWTCAAKHFSGFKVKHC